MVTKFTSLIALDNKFKLSRSLKIRNWRVGSDNGRALFSNVLGQKTRSISET